MSIHPAPSATAPTADAATERFVITVSARALFDMEADHAVFSREGKAAYAKRQAGLIDQPFEPGPALPLIKKLLAINAHIPPGQPLIDVVLLSRNSADTSERLFRSMEHHGVNIVRAILTDGRPADAYIEPLGARLFLSSNPSTVAAAIQSGIAAATIMPRLHGPASRHPYEPPRDDVRIAFDGDAVLFSDEAEKAYQQGGLAGFNEHERARADIPLPDGPFRGFLEMLHHLQQAFGDKDCPIRTALVTSRGMPSHRRALLTLQQWGVRVDESMFLGGCNKGPFLKAFGADLFLDDSERNIRDAVACYVSSGHVPYGARNVPGADENSFTGSRSSASPAPPRRRRIAG